MKNSSFTHTFSHNVYDANGKCPGEIEVRVEYTVDSYGCPARVNYNENDHPAEPAEICAVTVEMLNAPKSGRKPEFIDAWDWLYEEAGEWCDEHAMELAAAASLEIASSREDYADTQRGKTNGYA